MNISSLKAYQAKLKKPQKFEVILLNDDYTSMEFVVDVLRRFFQKEFLAAEADFVDPDNSTAFFSVEHELI